MKKVLYINGNPKNEKASYSRRVGHYYLDQLKASEKDVEVSVVNVYEDNVPLIDGDVLTAWEALGAGTEFAALSPSQQGKISRMSEILSQFKEADEYVFVTALWNFSLPPMLKAYTDNILITGETFYYTENGPVGLLTDKKATIIQASGGVYSEGPGASLEHGVNYLQTILGFIGITDVTPVYVEGVAYPDLSEEEKLALGLKKVDALFDLR